MESNLPIWKLYVKHSYYPDKICPGIIVNPSPKTSLILKKRGICFKRVDKGCWTLYFNTEEAWHEEDILAFYLSINMNLFYYITDFQNIQPNHVFQWTINGTENTLSFPDNCKYNKKYNSKILIHILLSPVTGLIKNGTSTNKIEFYSPKYYWEYIIIFRNGKNERKIEITDMDRQIIFSNAQYINIYAMPAIIIRSKEKILCKKVIKNRLQLVENTNRTKRVLYKNLPYPVPGTYVDSPPETTRCLVYV